MQQVFIEHSIYVRHCAVHPHRAHVWLNEGFGNIADCLMMGFLI